MNKKLNALQEAINNVLEAKYIQGVRAGRDGSAALDQIAQVITQLEAEWKNGPAPDSAIAGTAMIIYDRLITFLARVDYKIKPIQKEKIE